MKFEKKLIWKKKDKKYASQPSLAYQTWDLGHLFLDYETEISPYKANKKNYKA